MNKKLVIDLGIKILNKFGYDNFIIYIKQQKQNWMIIRLYFEI